MSFDRLSKINLLNTCMEVAVLAGRRGLALLFFPGQVDFDFVPVRSFAKAADMLDSRVNSESRATNVSVPCE